MHLTSVLLPAPFSPSSAWNEPGAHLQLDIVERQEVAEAHGHGDGVDAEGACGRWYLADDHGHEMAPMKSAELATAPNTPPCILIIFSAWS